MKVNLDNLSTFLGEGEFSLVCPTSFEPRWYSVLKSLNPELVREVILLKQSEAYPAIKHGLDFINSNNIHYTVCDLNISSPVKKARVLKDVFVEKIALPGRLLIDLSTFTHENLLIFYQFLDQMKNKENVTFLYTGAKDYSVNQEGEDKWLSRGVSDIRSVFGFPGVMFPSLKTHLVILAGFEYERAEKLIKELEPEIVSLGVAKKNSHYLDDHSVFFERLTAFIDSTVKSKSRVELFEFSCADPYETKRAVARQVNEHKGHNVVLSPMNTKVSTLGAALAAVENDLIQICYVEPVEYNVDGYSTAGDEVTVLRSLVDSVTSVGSLINVKSDIVLRERFESLSVAPHLISLFYEARQKRPPTNKTDEDKAKLLAAAMAYSGLVSSLNIEEGQNFDPNNGQSLLYYYSVMNEALCYFFLKKYGNALALYKKLELGFDSFPMLFHRLGQVYSRMGQYSTSIKRYKKALSLVNSCEKMEIIGSDVLPELDYRHLKERCSYLLGYECWVKSISDSSLSENEKMKLLDEALAYTKLTIEYGEIGHDSLLDAHNNCLYYLLELSGLPQYHTGKEELKDSIEMHLLELERLYDDVIDISILDTLMKATNYLGDVEKALDYAKRIISIMDNVNNIPEKNYADADMIFKDSLNLISLYEFNFSS